MTAEEIVAQLESMGSEGTARVLAIMARTILAWA